MISFSLGSQPFGVNSLGKHCSNTLIAMNAAVALDKQSPASVASAFLKANRLL